MRTRSELAVDLRLGARAAFGRRSGALLVVATIAIVMGLSTAFFALWQGAHYRAIDAESPEELVSLYPVSKKHLRALRGRVPSFSGLGVAVTGSTVLEGKTATHVHVALVAQGWLETVRPRLLLGRLPSSWDYLPWTEPTVIISAELWQRLFDGSPDVIGQTVVPQGAVRPRAHIIIGVMSDGFVSPRDGMHGTDIWMPWRSSANASDTATVAGVARLGAGKSLEDGRRDLDAARASAFGPVDPGFDPGAPIRVYPFHRTGWNTQQDALFGVWVCSLLLLVVGCANLGTHLLGRALDRRRERALAVAVGAAPLRLTRQVLLTGGLHAAAGALLAIPVAAVAMRLVQANYPSAAVNPGFRNAGLGLPALLHLGVGALIVALAISLPGITQIPRTDLHRALASSARTHSGSRTARRIREGLLALQVALGFLLVVLAGASLKEIIRRTAAKGFTAGDVVYLRTEFHSAELMKKQARLKAQVVDRLRSDPDVEAVAHAFPEPLAHTADVSRSQFVIEGRGAGERERSGSSMRRTVGGDFLEVLRIPLLRGRWFRSDDSDHEVAVVDEAFADQFFPGEDPIGRRLRPARAGFPSTIIGVVGNVKHVPGLEIPPTYYLPSANRMDDSGNFLVRPRRNAAGVLAALERAVREVEPRLPIVSVGHYTDLIASRLSSPVMVATWTAVLGCLALFITGLGLRGAAAALVVARTNELGLRAAVGAPKVRLLALVLRQGLRPIGWGLVLGVVAGLLTGQSTVLGAWFPELSGLALPGATAAVAIVFLAGMLALIRPALRARKLPPAAALRYE